LTTELIPDGSPEALEAPQIWSSAAVLNCNKEKKEYSIIQNLIYRINRIGALKKS
jgi:hypothetical protein